MPPNGSPVITTKVGLGHAGGDTQRRGGHRTKRLRRQHTRHRRSQPPRLASLASGWVTRFFRARARVDELVSSARDEHRARHGDLRRDDLSQGAAQAQPCPSPHTTLAPRVYDGESRNSVASHCGFIHHQPALLLRDMHRHIAARTAVSEVIQIEDRQNPGATGPLLYQKHSGPRKWTLHLVGVHVDE